MGSEGLIAADRETVTKRIESLIRQLEGLAFSKNEKLAARICGGIEMLLWARDLEKGSAGRDAHRVEAALGVVMSDRAPVQGMGAMPFQTAEKVDDKAEMPKSD